MSNKLFNLNENVINTVRNVLVNSQEQEINSLVEQATSLFFAHNKDTSKTLPVFVKEYVMKKTMNPTLATICETVAKDNEKNLTETVERRGPQMLNEAAGSMPRSAREKKLAAMAHPKDKITHKDVLVGRGVVAKEEVEQIDELKSSTLAGYIVKASKSAIGTAAAGDTRTTKNRKFGIERAVNKLYKRAPDAPKDPWDDPKFYNAQFKNRQESTDTPGNSYKHQCAIHVKHEQFGEGRTIFSQHAEPDHNGNIAWYDVMFDHGIEKQVSINEMHVLHSESHMMHKKKKMKEDVEQIDELSKDTVGSYALKAHRKGDMATRMSKDSNDDMGKIARKKYGYTQLAIRKLSGNARVNATEEVEQIDEISGDMASRYISKAKANAKKTFWNADPDERDFGETGRTLEKRKKGIAMALKKKYGGADVKVRTTEEVEQIDEMMSDPETLRADRSTETRTTPSGRRIIVKKPKKDLKVEEVEYVDEAKRGRPRKNPLPAGQTPQEGDKEHFIMQLRKSVSMRGKKDVEFDNGDKVKVPSHIAAAVLDHYNSLKTAEQKDRLHKSVSKSPKHLMSHYEMYHGN